MNEKQLTFNCKIAYNGSGIEINASINPDDYKTVGELFLKATQELNELQAKLRNEAAKPQPPESMNAKPNQP